VTFFKQYLNDLASLISYVTISPIARLIPKQSGTVVVFAPENGTFSDNAKYAYLALTEQSSLRVCYILYDRKEARILRGFGINAFAYPQPAAIGTMLRATVAVGVALFPFRQTIGHWTSSAKKVQLWHGSGVKKIGLDRQANVGRATQLYYRFKWLIERMHPTFDVLFLPSKRLQDWRSTSFRSKNTQINGLLRNDILFGRSFAKRELLGCDSIASCKIDALKAAGKSLILYAPTFRSRTQPTVGTRIPLDLAWFNSYLRYRNAALIIKLHPHMPDTLDITQHENIIEYHRKLDIYPHLAKFDLMITDFSSFATDFALTGKPIIRYIPDYEIWQRSGRINPEAASEMPGAIFTTFETLSQSLLGGFPVGGETASAFHDFRDGQSCHRFVKTINELLAK